MKKQFIKKMQQKLIDERSLIIKAAEGSKNQSVDFDGDEADEVQANLLVYVNDQVHSRYRTSLIKINNALLKITNSTYGICDDCEEEISEKRLEFNPYFDTCVRCAEIREKEAKQSR